MSHQAKKIIFAANAGWYLWNFRRNLMHNLKDAGYEVIAVSGGDEYADRLAKEFPVTIMKHLDRGGMNPLKDLLLIAEYIRLYKKLKPDVVLNMTIKPNIYSSIACQVLHIPAVSTVTGLGYAFTKDNWLQKLVSIMYRFAFRNAYTVMFQNSDDQQLFLDKKMVTAEKTVLVPGSGVDTKRFDVTPLPGHGQVITFLLIARMLKDKGVYQFAEAAERIHKKFPDTKLVLAGPLDPNNPACISMKDINVWEKAGVVKYLGSIDDVVPVMAAADVVVLPSWYREGIPKSLLEAMALARPVITTDIPGCRSVIDNDRNGFLIEPKNTNALVDAIERMIMTSDEQRHAMGIVGRELVEQKFDQTIVFDIHKKILREILD